MACGMELILCTQYTHHLIQNLLDVCFDVQIDEVQVWDILLREGCQWDDSLLDGMTHTLSHHIHLGLVLTNSFKEWHLWPE
jgi:hypothetical protein